MIASAPDANVGEAPARAAEIAAGAAAHHDVLASRLGHLPALDGLRGVAVLAVMAYHGSNWATGGFLGVDVFFALSGFLITALLVRERVETGRVSLRRFYARRALRLLPPLLAMLAIYLLAAAALDPPRFVRHLEDAGMTLLYVANVPRALGIPRPVYLAPCWSLAVEEHFYLVWPPLLLWLVARVHDARRLARLVMLLAFAAWALRVGLLAVGVHTSRLYYVLATRADALMIGAALGVAHGAGLLPVQLAAPTRRRLAIGTALVAAAWLALFLTGHFNDKVNHLWRFTFMAATTCLLILAGCCDRDGPVARALAWPPLAGVGRISYALYLWHYPIFLALHRNAGLSLDVTLALGFALTLAAASASYRFVEAPALRLKRRFA